MKSIYFRKKRTRFICCCFMQSAVWLMLNINDEIVVKLEHIGACWNHYINAMEWIKAKQTSQKIDWICCWPTFYTIFFSFNVFQDHDQNKLITQEKIHAEKYRSYFIFWFNAFRTIDFFNWFVIFKRWPNRVYFFFFSHF